MEVQLYSFSAGEVCDTVNCKNCFSDFGANTKKKNFFVAIAVNAADTVVGLFQKYSSVGVGPGPGCSSSLRNHTQSPRLDIALGLAAKNWPTNGMEDSFAYEEELFISSKIS